MMFPSAHSSEVTGPMLRWPLRSPSVAGAEGGLRNEGVCLVVGLGNPGPKYHHTRHNVGFMVVRQLAERHAFTISKNFRRAITGSWTRPDGTILVAEPQTFMNASGECVKAIAQFYHLQPNQVLVICDDVSLPFGRLRIRRAGSEGGHNGLRSLSQCLGTREYPRLRVGVGKPPERWDMIDYVLAPFTRSEMEEMPSILDKAADAIECAVQEGVEASMNRFNAG